jgi:isoleucyl-tRNA synthetase
MVPRGAMLEVDRFALSRLAALSAGVRQAYLDYDFQAIFHAVNDFVTVDVSAFHADVSKDRLYTFRADSLERRSAQTACYVIADALARLLAPILSVTTDEVWRTLPGPREDTVHLALFPPAALQDWADADLDDRWNRLLAIRASVNQALEGARQRKEIGSALAAHVTIRASGAEAALLDRYRDDLPMLFITSSVDVTAGTDGLTVEVTRAEGEKCPRCWRVVGEIAPTGTCHRCADAMKAPDAA